MSKGSNILVISVVSINLENINTTVCQHSSNFRIEATWNFLLLPTENHLVMALGGQLRELPPEQAHSDQKKVIYCRL